MKSTDSITITIAAEETPGVFTKETAPGTFATLITARTFEEAVALYREEEARRA